MQEFVIDVAKAGKLRHASRLGVEPFLASLAKPTADLARAPISKFQVGAVGLGVSGRIFLGVNLEFPKLPLNHSVHAEQFLVANALQHGEKRLVFIAVSAAPCGHCRQFLQELRDAGDIRLLITDGKDPQVRPLSYFLPHRFGPDDLMSRNFPLLLESRSNDLILASFGAWLRDNKHSLVDLKLAAFAAANASYAPYSRCPSGASLVTRKGQVYSGSYIESAAYNPGLPALQAAIVAFICGGGGAYDEIDTVIIVERKGALVRHAPTARLALQSIAPQAAFHHFEVDVQSRE
uniref:cytidine deaminase n=1 Tax=Physcomitrium patens TaxID=3218 RepID=A9U3W5_PHYPA